MTFTSMSEKGQVVIPKPIREGLDLRPSDTLQVGVENGKIILSPITKINEFLGVIKVKKPITKQEIKVAARKRVLEKAKRYT